MLVLRKFTDVLNEAKVGRAWEGKLARIEKLIQYMDDNNLLSKGDSSKFESVARRYNRWYNDGDIPKGSGISKDELQYNQKSASERIDQYLEELLEDTLRTILSKKLKKVDRTDFRYSEKIKNLELIKNMVAHSSYFPDNSLAFKVISDTDLQVKLKEIHNLGQKVVRSLSDRLDMIPTYEINTYIDELQARGEKLSSDESKLIKKIDKLRAEVISEISALINTIEMMRKDRILKSKK